MPPIGAFVAGGGIDLGVSIAVRDCAAFAGKLRTAGVDVLASAGAEGTLPDNPHRCASSHRCTGFADVENRLFFAVHAAALWRP